MTNIQGIFIFLFSTHALYGIFRGYYECSKKENAYGLTPQFYLHGAFVWADIFVFGFFWVIVGMISLIRQDWLLFLLIFMVFWVVRSAGETIYWFLQQFSTVIRVTPKQSPFYPIVRNDSVWFIHQIIAQLITVVSLLATIILIPLWLKSLFEKI